MKRLSQLLTLIGFAAVLSIGTAKVVAQERQERGGDRGERRNFDPEEMRKRMMERYREELEVKNDDEWKLIEVRITKVSDARREIGFGGGGMMFRGRRGGEGGNGGDQGQRRGFGGGTPSPEVESLQKALEAKAPAEEIKAKLAKVREARKQKEANLAKAQDDLRKVLSVRQEATAVMMGLLQ